MFRMFAILAILVSLLSVAAPVAAQEHYQRPQGEAPGVEVPPVSNELVGLPMMEGTTSWCPDDTSSDDCPVLPLAVNSDSPFVAEAIDMWNAAAGIELFSFTPNDRRAPIQVYPTLEDDFEHGAFTISDPGEKCALYTRNEESFSNLLAHELGHCLGFVDVFNSIDFVEEYTDSFLCTDESHDRYTAYRGIMSYCTYMQGIRMDDVCSLYLAHYPVVIPPNTECVLAGS